MVTGESATWAAVICLGCCEAASGALCSGMLWACMAPDIGCVYIEYVAMGICICIEGVEGLSFGDGR